MKSVYVFRTASGEYVAGEFDNKEAAMKFAYKAGLSYIERSHSAEADEPKLPAKYKAVAANLKT